MSRFTKSPKSATNVSQEDIAQFCGVTGAAVKDARKFLEKYRRVDAAIDAYFDDPNAFSRGSGASSKAPEASSSKLGLLFDKYKDPDGPDITVDGTIALCNDLNVDPEDVVMLAVAYELGSNRMGEWNKTGWVDGWKKLGCDTLPAMQSQIPKLRDRLGSDAQYFNAVYGHTFQFARSEGQRSLGLDSAIPLWNLLLTHGLKGGALAHTGSLAPGEQGWKEEYDDMWFEFLQEKALKGVSKDTWNMFLEFVRTIDAEFKTYDAFAEWPSTIDEFVEWMKAKLGK